MQNAVKRTKKTRVVIIGAGFGGVYTFYRLHKHFHKYGGVELVLVSDTNYFLFAPLLHEVATGNIDPAIVVEPLRKVLGCCMAEFHKANVSRINTREKQVETSRGSISYDYAVVALGSVTDFAGIEGAAEYTFPLKSMSDAIRIKNHVIGAVERASSLVSNDNQAISEETSAYIDELLHFVVVGGGPTGVELAAELADLCYYTFNHYYSRKLIDRLRITLIQLQGELMPQFDPVLRKKSLDVLQAKDVTVRLGVGVEKITENELALNNGQRLSTRSVIWTAGVKPADISFDGDIEREQGKIMVDEYLRVPSVQNVYAIGDIAYHKVTKGADPTPALAQAATKQGKYVGDRIADEVYNRRPQKPFFYKHDGTLVSLGKWRAVGEVKGVKLYGRFTWWLWRTVYLSKVISWTKKLKIAIDWTLNIFARRDISQFSACPDKFSAEDCMEEDEITKTPKSPNNHH